ncbi:MAG: hypothetical protein IPK04_19975 [Bdellovibrionales bacterium]|jgi:hypothetical protein|nr:hypothetical protein [Bdellovibrionales bacterium]MBL7670798.1 hypothetical protein [Pseudobdellovibrionaceae bacterium]
MKTVFALVFFSSICFGYNTKYFDLHSNSTTKIDVKDEDSTISLRVSIQSPSSFSVPEASVIEEDSGFECRITKTLLLYAGYDAVNKIHHQDYEIKVNWSPGADQSGCLIEVRHPSLTDSRAYLFMNY